MVRGQPRMMHKKPKCGAKLVKIIDISKFLGEKMQKNVFFGRFSCKYQKKLVTLQANSQNSIMKANKKYEREQNDHKGKAIISAATGKRVTPPANSCRYG